MNICLGLILIVLCVFLGFRLSRRFLDKRIFYQNFLNFNEKFKSEVSFKQELLKDIVYKFKNESEVFYKSVYSYFYLEKRDLREVKFLNNEEKEYFFNYVSALGKVDKDSQIEYLSESQKYLTDKLNLAICHEKKYKTLYIKLGLLFGLIIFIILL